MIDSLGPKRKVDPMRNFQFHFRRVQCVIGLFMSLILSFSVNATVAQEFDRLLDEIEGSVESDDFEPESTVEIHGFIKELKKYSIIVQSGTNQFQVKLPITVPIQRELFRPKLDLERSLVTMTLPCTGPGGDQTMNQVVKLPLPSPVYFRGRFGNENELQAFLDGKSNRIIHYSLFAEMPVAGDMEIIGELKQIGNRMMLQIDGKHRTVFLGNRTNLLSGFSILDLEEKAEVSLVALQTENGLVAQDIHFQKYKQADTLDQLPSILSLGDMVSFSYQRALHMKYEGKFNVFHPPVNCGGSKNWVLLDRWLGDYSEQKWDVILFNCGVLDDRMSKENYQRNLNRWIEKLQEAGKQIVWISSTPIPSTDPMQTGNNIVGKVPGRMRLQNQWAQEVFERFPNVKTCDLWTIVKEDTEGEFQQWWKEDRIQFNYPQSKVLVEAIAKTISDP